MAETKHNAVFDFTSGVTAMFTKNLFVARTFKDKKGNPVGEPKYDGTFEIDANHPDLKPLKALCVEVARAKWPGVDLSTLQFPIQNGDKIADKQKAKGKDRESARGKAVLIARSQYEPRLSVVQNGTISDYEGDRRPLAKPFFYDGVSVLVEVNLEAYDGVGANPDGVTAYLNMVCSLNKGERIGSAGRPAAEVFKGYAGNLSTEDPTQSDLSDTDELPM